MESAISMGDWEVWGLPCGPDASVMVRPADLRVRKGPFIMPPSPQEVSRQGRARRRRREARRIMAAEYGGRGGGEGEKAQGKGGPGGRR